MTTKTALVINAFNRKVLLWTETDDAGNTTLNDGNTKIPVEPGDDLAAITQQWVATNSDSAVEVLA